MEWEVLMAISSSNLVHSRQTNFISFIITYLRSWDKSMGRSFLGKICKSVIKFNLSTLQTWVWTFSRILLSPFGLYKYIHTKTLFCADEIFWKFSSRVSVVNSPWSFMTVYNIKGIKCHNSGSPLSHSTDWMFLLQGPNTAWAGKECTWYLAAESTATTFLFHFVPWVWERREYTTFHSFSFSQVTGSWHF